MEDAYNVWTSQNLEDVVYGNKVVLTANHVDILSIIDVVMYPKIDITQSILK